MASGSSCTLFLLAQAPGSGVTPLSGLAGLAGLGIDSDDRSGMGRSLMTLATAGLDARRFASPAETVAATALTSEMLWMLVACVACRSEITAACAALTAAARRAELAVVSGRLLNWLRISMITLSVTLRDSAVAFAGVSGRQPLGALWARLEEPAAWPVTI